MAERTASQGEVGPVQTAIRARRVTRVYQDRPVGAEQVRQVLEAARWAPSGGNRRLNLFVVVQAPERMRLLRAAAPGILGHPAVLIAVCVDRAKLQHLGMDDRIQGSAYVDVGAATENMLLAAHELGLGACPVMSFHHGALRLLLDLPEAVEPVLLVALGYPVPSRPGPTRPPLRLLTVEEITHWERYRPEEASDG